MLQGDVHRFYHGLRRHFPEPPDGAIPQLDHVREIAHYYAQLDPTERDLLLAWARKEESGIGLIPAALSGIPVIGLIFAPLFQSSLRQVPTWLLFVVWLVGGIAFTMGIYIHQRQRAYTTLHIEILEQLGAPRAD